MKISVHKVLLENSEKMGKNKYIFVMNFIISQTLTQMQLLAFFLEFVISKSKFFDNNKKCIHTNYFLDFLHCLFLLPWKHKNTQMRMSNYFYLHYYLE